MLCKIADDSQAAQPITWRTLTDPTAALSPNAPSQLANGNRPTGIPTTPEVAELRKRIEELERLRQSDAAAARQAGFQEGVQKAREEGAQQIKAAVDALAAKLKEVAVLRQKVRNQGEMDVVKLAVAIARRILRRELATDPEALHGVVHTALQKIQNRDIIKVRVYAGALEAVRTGLERAGAAPAIQVVADPTLKLGDLLFETNFGELDTSMDTQMQEIERGLTDRIGR